MSNCQRDSSVMMSSVMPSLKYVCSGSPPGLANGSTQIETRFGPMVAAGGPELDAMTGRVQEAYDSQGLFHGVLGEVTSVTKQWTETNKSAAVAGKELADAEARAKASTEERSSTCASTLVCNR